jgi:hypothetical protein
MVFIMEKAPPRLEEVVDARQVVAPASKLVYNVLKWRQQHRVRGLIELGLVGVATSTILLQLSY